MIEHHSKNGLSFDKIFSILKMEIISVKFIMFQKFVYICMTYNTK